MDADYFAPLTEARRLGEIYAFAYGYQLSSVQSFLDGRQTIDRFKEEIDELTARVTAEAERVMMDMESKIAGVMGEGADIMVTNDIDKAREWQRRHPDGIIVEAP